MPKTVQTVTETGFGKKGVVDLSRIWASAVSQ